MLEWENHTRSYSPNTLAEVLEAGGSGTCWALLCAGLWCVLGSVLGADGQSSAALSPASAFPRSPRRHRFPITSFWPPD